VIEFQDIDFSKQMVLYRNKNIFVKSRKKLKLNTYISETTLNGQKKAHATVVGMSFFERGRYAGYLIRRIK
jgi:hypothetical protein